MFMSELSTVNPVSRGHFWDKEKQQYYKTGDILKRFNSCEIFYETTRKR